MEAGRPPRTPRDRIARIGGRIPGRAALWALVALILAGWLAFAFAGVLGESAELRERVARERAVNEEMRARAEAGAREIALLDDEGFLDQLARAWGLGAGRERAFSLADPDAPPAPLPQLPGAPEPAPEPGILDDLLRVLTGA